jgi:hypothetical protein
MEAPEPLSKRSMLATDLEVALHRILSRSRFFGSGNIRVSASSENEHSYCVVLIDLGAARVIARALDQSMFLPLNTDPVIWTFTSDRAQRIVSAIG